MSKRPLRIEESSRPFGGQYVPESLIESLEALQDAFETYWNDVSFRQEFNRCLAYMRPRSQLQSARRLSRAVGGARIYLKREDLNHTGSHSITNALGQALIARRLGKSKILAETGSGGHGVATAAVCQLLGLDCIVYMGSKDVKQRPDQVKRMQNYGAKVIEVTQGNGTIREATTEVLRAAVEMYETAYPLLGGAYGPRPLPMIANAFQAVIGEEVKAQMRSITGKLPNAVIACAGIHSPGVGLFDSFIHNEDIKLVAVEGAGNGESTDEHAAVLTYGTPGVYHGAHTLVLQDTHGQIEQVRSIAPDLCYPGVSPWMATWRSEGRVTPAAVSDGEAVLGCIGLSRVEGIECSIEDGHAVAAGIDVAAGMESSESVVICLGGGA